MAGEQVGFAIGIAAAMPEGDATIAQLDALSERLTGAGKNADFFKDALSRVGNQLDAAKAASVAANSALAAGQQEYRELERAALQAAKSAEKAALTGVIPPDVAARASATAAAVNAYAGKLDVLEREAAQAAAQQARLATVMGNVQRLQGHVNARFTAGSESLAKLRGGLGQVGGPLGALGNKALAPAHAFAELSQVMGAAAARTVLVIAGFAALAIGLAALGTAAIAAGVALTGLAIASADAARSGKLAAEAFDAANPRLAGLRDTMRDTTRVTGLGADKLQKLALSLESAGVAAEDLPEALHAAALAERALGEGGSAKFIEQIKAGRLGVQEFARDAQSDLGGIVARQMLSLEAQGDRLRSNFGSLFSGLDIEPLLEGLSRLVSLFDASTASGQTLKFLVETVFQPIVEWLGKALVVAEAFFLGLAIGAVKAYIAFKPVLEVIGELLGWDDSTFADTLTMAKVAGEALVYVVGLLAAGFAAVVAVGAVVLAAMLAIPAAFYAVWEAGQYVGQQIVAFFKPETFVRVGSDLVAGLAQGILSGAGAVVGAATGVANAAVGAAKRALGIASPSRVFAGIGEFTAEGFAEGVEGSSGEAQGALEDMVAPPAALSNVQGSAGGAPAPAAASADGGSASGGAPLVDLRGASLVFNGVKDGPASIEALGEALTTYMQGKLAHLQGAPA